MKKLKTITLIFFGLAITALLYQNCGGQGPSNSLCFGSNCSTAGGSTGCPAATPHYIASTNSCQNCQYGYNSATQTCTAYNPPGANPSYSCGIYAVNSQQADPSRNCATGCTLNPNETLKCESKSFILAPNDYLYGCMDTNSSCTNQLSSSEWVKSSITEGAYTYSVYTYTYVNVHQGPTDVQQNTIMRDSQNRLSPVMKVLIKTSAGSGGSNFGPQSYSLTCNAGNNATNSVTQALTLPSGVNASDLRFTSTAVTSWTNNGFNTGQTYTNPPIFKASFTSNTLKFDCNQAAATVTFTVATNQGGNATWEITNRSQLP